MHHKSIICVVSDIFRLHPVLSGNIEYINVDKIKINTQRKSNMEQKNICQKNGKIMTFPLNFMKMDSKKMENRELIFSPVSIFTFFP